MAAALAGGALFGWASGALWLTRYANDSNELTFVTALCLLALATAVLLPRRHRTWRAPLAVVVLVLALVSVVEYVTGTGLIAELVVSDEVDELSSAPGRMAPNALAAITLLACAVLMSARRPGLAQGAAVTAAAIGIVAFLGFASDVPQLYAATNAPSLSLPAAVAIAALGASTALESAAGGWMLRLLRDSPGAGLLRLLLPWAVGIPCGLAILRLAGERAGLFGAGIGVWLMAAGTVVLVAVALVVAAMWLDRTDARRRIADASWRDEQARFAAAFETLLDPFVLVRPVRGADGAVTDFVFDYANPAAAHDPLVHGRHLVGAALLDVLPRGLETGLFAAMVRVLDRGDPLRVDNLSYPDGDEPRVIDVRATAVPDGLVLTWRDRTAHDRLEREAGRTAELLHGVLDNTSALISVKTTDEHYVLANRAYAALYGRQPFELVGRKATEVLPPETAAVVVANDATALRERRPVERMESVTLDGRTRHFLSVRFPLFDAGGDPSAIGSVSADVTQLRELSVDLERRVADRTRELEIANHELEAFSYSVSHDLRAPLRAIDEFSRLVIDEHADELSEDGVRDLERVRGAAQRMAGLIDELLKLSRLSRRPMQRQSVDLTALAGEVLEDLRAANPEYQAEVAVDEGLTADGDPTLLRTLLQNLLSNALKFTVHAAHPRVTVGTAETGAGRAFYVRDNGAGFDPRFADRLFRPFERLHSEAEYAGTGVGLATVQRVARRHGGRVWGEGEPGRGATFFFTLDPNGGVHDGPEGVPPWTGG